MASLKEDDEMVQEAALNELTELMSMSSEESLTVLPLEQLVPQLVRHLFTKHALGVLFYKMPSSLLLLNLEVRPGCKFEFK